MGTAYLKISTPKRRGRKSKWGISYYSPWDIKPDGSKERIRRFFETKELRDQEIERLTDRFSKFGASTFELPSPEEVAEYREAKAMLPVGVLLKAAVSAGLRALNRDGPLLLDFSSTYIAQLEAKVISKNHLSNVRSLLGRFAASFPASMRITEPTSEQCRAWLASLKGQKTKAYSAGSIHGFRRILHGLFEYAMTEGKRSDNPIHRIAAPKVQRRTPVVYTIAETRAILGACLLHDPALMPALVLRAFLGVRTSEVLRMLDSDILRERRIIDLPGFREIAPKSKKSAKPPGKKLVRVTKSGKRRIIEDAPEIVWYWLDRFPHLDTKNMRKRLEAVMQKSGIFTKKNAFRHNFATYHVALKKSADLTILILGQEENSTVFYKHYRNPNIGQAEAIEYFGLTLTSILPWAGGDSDELHSSQIPSPLAA